MHTDILVKPLGCRLPQKNHGMELSQKVRYIAVIANIAVWK